MAIAKRKKKFFNVEIPLINKQTQLQAYETKELNGKLIDYDLTRVLRGKSMILQLKVKLENEKPTTTPRKIKLMPYFLRRAVRKGTNYIEDSFSTKCKNAQVRIKPFLISRRKVSRAVRKALREKAKEELIKYVKNKTAENLFDEILKNQIQKILSLKLKKIYPLALCEIRIFEIEKDLEPKEEKVEETKKEKKENISSKEPKEDKK
jgi:ribosomal protein S3AE